jgi:hypothetical protein
MPTPSNTKLYAEVKADADARFLAPTSIYKSAWIVAEYKRRGGTYNEDGKRKGLTQWFKEKWVDLNRPIKGDAVGYEPCGRPQASTKGTYPLCRPFYRVNKDTPLTVGEIQKAKSAKQLRRIDAEKQKGKHLVRVRFHK